MTRDYNNQRRDDVRPPSRNQSSGRPGDKPFPRPARPRLNRETVDRAWESGANTQHADYHTRSSNGSNRQPSRNNWRNNQPSGNSSAQNDRRPFSNRQDSNRERPPYSNTGPRSRSFDTDRRSYDDQRSNSGGPPRNAARPAFHDNRNPRPYEQRFRDNNQDPGYQRRDSGRYERQPGSFENRPPRNSDRKRNDRPSYNAQQPDTQNPRWRSRPTAQRYGSFDKQQHSDERAPQNARYEGDYEGYNSSEDRRRFPDRTSRSRAIPAAPRPQPQAEEPPVTRLPDGRVLKGPRPVQRKNAQFWTEIAHETGDLVNPVKPMPASPEGQAVNASQEVSLTATPAEQAVDASQDTPLQAMEPAKAQRKPRTRAASTVKRDKKSDGKKSAAKPRSAGPRPSRRGFKWPEP